MAKYWVGKPKQIEGALVPQFGCYVFTEARSMAICQAFGRSEEEAHNEAQCIIAAIVAVEQKPAVAAKARHYIVRSKPYESTTRQVQNIPRDTPGLKVTPLVKPYEPTTDDVREYDRYFDKCEEHNKSPLGIDDWIAKGRPDYD